MKIEDMGESSRIIISIIATNLLLSMIAMFAYPGQWLLCLAFPWAVFLLSFVGYIPFAGFLVFYWLYKEVLIKMIWTLEPSWFTSLMFFIYLSVSIIRTLQWSAKLSGQVRDKEG